MNSHDYHSVFSCLSQAIEILDRNRTPDPHFVAAYDTLRQSRAMLAGVLQIAHGMNAVKPEELAAA